MLQHRETESTCFENMLKAVACGIHRLLIFCNSTQHLKSSLPISSSKLHCVQKICNHLQDYLHNIEILTITNEFTA